MNGGDAPVLVATGDQGPNNNITVITQSESGRAFAELIFNIPSGTTLRISKAVFEEYWDHVDHIWTAERGVVKRKYGWFRAYMCRLANVKKSSEQRTIEPGARKRKATEWEEGMCDARLTVKYFEAAEYYEVHNTNGMGTHQHDLQLSDMRKMSKTIRNEILDQVHYEYKPAALVKGIKKAREKKNEKDLVTYLTRQDVKNVQTVALRSERVSRAPEPSVEQDVCKGHQWLREKGYHAELLVTESAYGVLVFASAKHLEYLAQFGFFCLLDATHNMNASKWKLFTVYIRTSAGVWLPGGHFFASEESIESVAEGLKALKRLANRWKPRYFIIDQSASEEGGINLAFGGLKVGEAPSHYILHQEIYFVFPGKL